MITITATEFKTNFGKYLELGSKETILVTKNGKLLTTLNPPKVDFFDDFFDELIGICDESKADLSDPRIAHMLGKL